MNIRVGVISSITNKYRALTFFGHCKYRFLPEGKNIAK